MNDFFLWDTYAFFELIEGSHEYLKRSKHKAVTTIFNLAELNYNLKKDRSKKESDEITNWVKNFLVDVETEDIIAAGDLKKKNRKLSIPDCIGYVVAKRIGAKFLTGDKEFEKIKNVEFVK